MKRGFLIYVFLFVLNAAVAQQPATNSTTTTDNFAASTIDETKSNAEKGDVQAQLKLGMAHYYGEGVSKDFGEASKWLRKVEAESGNSTVQFFLFSCYVNNSAQKDVNEGIKWLYKSAENGYIVAQLFLGNAYAQSLFGTKMGDLKAFERLGFRQDYSQAFKWYKRAANQGDSKSQSFLGACYLDGLGVPKNRIEAYKWFNLAAAQNSPGANHLRDSLGRSMTSQEIAKAEQLSAAFVARKEEDYSVSGKNISPETPTASGTGFFITDDGYLVSNYHVVKGAAKVRLQTGAGLVEATMVKVDAANDLALLKAVGRFAPLPIAASRGAKLGSTVATVGFPSIGLQGFSPKLAKGEIASLSGAGDDPRYFQISVPVQPGNSGGALVDAHGNVVGIVAAKLNAQAALDATGQLPENVNYAVKSSLLLSFLESVPEVASKLKDPSAKDAAFEDVVKSAQDAAVLVLVY